MKRLYQVVLTIALTALSFIAQADCPIAKSYIVTISGNGYQMAGKLVADPPGAKTVAPYATTNFRYSGGLAYMAKISSIRASQVDAVSTVTFKQNCDMEVTVDIGGIYLRFTAYTDATVNANGVILGDVVLEPGKVAGITGGIRISEK